jgi:hypothetical protein
MQTNNICSWIFNFNKMFYFLFFDRFEHDFITLIFTFNHKILKHCFNFFTLKFVFETIMNFHLKDNVYD